MSWLDRLKALPPKDCGLPTHRQNRQNPGSVSFGTAQVAQSLANEDVGGGEREQAEDAREAFEERAAIMEYDGGLSRADAERAARMQLGGEGSATDAAPPLAASEPFPPRPIPDEWGDMRPCEWCRNLTRAGRCMSAWRGEMRTARDYAPTFPGQPLRCYFYDPRARDPDMREGRERWPELVWQVRIPTEQPDRARSIPERSIFKRGRNDGEIQRIEARPR